MRNVTADPVLRHIHRLIAARSMDHLADECLVERYAADRDVAAFETLLQRHGPMVLRVCRQVLHDWHEAEDAFQATFLVLARQASRIRKREVVASWLHGVAYRVAMQAKSQAMRRTLLERSPQAKPAAQPVAEITWRQVQEALHEELGRLAAGYRLPLVLCYLEGKTQDEAAHQLGWSKGTVRRRLERGRVLLARRLTRRGVSLSAALVAAGLTQPTAACSIPLRLIAATLKNAVGFACPSEALAGGSSTGAAALAQATLSAMAPTLTKMMMALIAAACLIAAGVGVLLRETVTTPAQILQANKVAGSEQKTEPTDGKQPPSDRDGDPLPEGAVARLGTKHFRQNVMIHKVVFSPDGKLVAGRGWMVGIQYWDVASGKEVSPLQSSGNCVAFSPDGKTVATSTASLWDLTTGKMIRRLVGHHVTTLALAFTPDGKFLLSGGLDGTVRVWDVDIGKELREMQGHEGEVGALAISADGRTAASGSQDKTVRLWDIATGKALRVFQGHQGEVASVALSPDGKTLASGSRDKTMRLWDVASGATVHTLPAQQDQVQSVAFSPDGRMLAGTGDHYIRLWDVATGKEIRSWKGHAERVQGLAFSPNGKLLASVATYDSAIHFWDPATGKEIEAKRGHCGPVNFLRFTDDGKSLISRGRDQKSFQWDLASGMAREIDHLILDHDQGTMQALAVSPDARLVASGGFFDHTIRLWESATGRLVRVLGKHEEAVRCVTFAPDGSLLASGGRDNVVRLWDPATGKELHALRGHTREIWKLRFSPDGHVLASGSLDGTACIWDVGTGKQLQQLHADPEQWVWQLAFSPSGALLVASGQNGRTHVWDVATGRERPGLAGSQNGADALAFSADGKLLAAGGGQSDPNVVHVWEMASGHEVRTYEGHNTPVFSLAFSQDSRTLAAGGADSTILLWDLTGRTSTGRWPALHLTHQELEARWQALTADAEQAMRALWDLAASPREAVAFLRPRLRLVWNLDEPRIARCLRELSDERFAVRRKAQADLQEMGEMAEPFLLRALAGKCTLEVRQRLEELLSRLDPASNREMLRSLRAVQALEYANSTEARQLLEELAKGPAEARVTREVKASLQRLAETKTR